MFNLSLIVYLELLLSDSYFSFNSIVSQYWTEPLVIHELQLLLPLPINPSLLSLFRFSALAMPVLQIYDFSRVPPSLRLGELLFLLFTSLARLRKQTGSRLVGLRLFVFTSLIGSCPAECRLRTPANPVGAFIPG